MTNEQLELGLGGSKFAANPGRRQSRMARAAWWFSQMRKVVDCALDWQAALQNFLAWSNEFGFGEDFTTTIGYPYIVCLSNHGVPPSWP